MEILNKEQKVTLTKEDMDAIVEMYNQFNIEIDPKFKEAIDNFKNDPTVENQQIVTLYTLKNQAELDHPVLRNKMFEAPSENARKIAQELQFERDLIEEIGRDEV